MSEILNLEPKIVWKNFHAITQIPHPSKKEEKIAEFIIEFAKKNNLEWEQQPAGPDGIVGNVIIRKPAASGMENRKGVVLQAHLDMVPQKNSEKVHDFEKDPIETRIADEGKWVRANGTTLGADNGIGVAAILSILESKDLQHGPIEALFTIDEETGMTGAFRLKAGMLKGDILMNLDSEDEGELYVGCAGGVDANITFNYTPENIPANMSAFTLSVTGLSGGHSGMDIVQGKGNANKILFRFLKTASKKYAVRIASINGGSLRNAIPREAFACILIPNEKIDAAKAELKTFQEIVVKELSQNKNETKPEIKLEPAPMPASVIDAKTQNNLINAVYGCPNGVIRMSDSMQGLVETSTNLAIVKSNEKQISVNCLLRSSVDSAKEDLGQMISCVMELAGANCSLDGAYPGWKPNMDSPILKTMQEIYHKMYGKTPEIKAIHAGLECGLLGGAYPNWDMISFGPTIRNPHSPDERVEIASVKKFWDYLVETLKNIPAK